MAATFEAWTAYNYRMVSAFFDISEVASILNYFLLVCGVAGCLYMGQRREENWQSIHRAFSVALSTCSPAHLPSLIDLSSNLAQALSSLTTAHARMCYISFTLASLAVLLIFSLYSWEARYWNVAQRVEPEATFNRHCYTGGIYTCDDATQSTIPIRGLISFIQTTRYLIAFLALAFVFVFRAQFRAINNVKAGLITQVAASQPPPSIIQPPSASTPSSQVSQLHGAHNTHIADVCSENANLKGQIKVLKQQLAEEKQERRASTEAQSRDAVSAQEVLNDRNNRLDEVTHKLEQLQKAHAKVIKTNETLKDRRMADQRRIDTQSETSSREKEEHKKEIDAYQVEKAHFIKQSQELAKESAGDRREAELHASRVRACEEEIKALRVQLATSQEDLCARTLELKNLEGDYRVLQNSRFNRDTTAFPQEHDVPTMVNSEAQAPIDELRSTTTETAVPTIGNTSAASFDDSSDNIIPQTLVVGPTDSTLPASSSPADEDEPRDELPPPGIVKDLSPMFDNPPPASAEVTGNGDGQQRRVSGQFVVETGYLAYNGRNA